MKPEQPLPFAFWQLNITRRHLQNYHNRQLQQLRAELASVKQERQELYELLFHPKENTPDFSELYPCAMNTPQAIPERTE